MYDVSGLITHIATVTSYTVKLLTDTKPSLAKFDSLPIVFVGTVGVKPLATFGSGRTDLDHQLFAEDLEQYIEIQFVCAASDLTSVWNTLGGAVAGWHEANYEAPYTGLLYAEGGVLGIENGRLWWADRWIVQFPRYSSQ